MPKTAGRRIYAIGDVHGCRAELRALRSFIEDDLRRYPHPRPLAVFLGDYVDRGPDIRGTIDDLIAWQGGPIETEFLRGNHDQYYLAYLEDPTVRATPRLHWLDANLGGGWTLRSYGIDRPVASTPEASHEAFVAAVPEAHVDFMAQTRFRMKVGGYVFVHAGLRPGVPLARQERLDLIFIREPFLSDPAPHEDGIVVHGHTPVNGIEHHGNRINVDGGAVFGGRLCCLVLEGERAWDLQPGGRVPVAEGYGLG